MSQSTREATLRSRFAQAEWLAAQLAQVREEGRLDRHPFVQRWVRGELTAADLQRFAAEHHHAAMALAAIGRRAAAGGHGLLAEQLRGYADAQEESVELSCAFAAGTGWGRSAWYFAQDPLPETTACVRTWVGESDSLAERLVTLWVVHASFAELAPRQLGALVEHYGFDRRSARYFARLGERAAGDAALGEAALTSLLPLTSLPALVDRAEAACRAYGELLDGVQMLAPRAS